MQAELQTVTEFPEQITKVLSLLAQIDNPVVEALILRLANSLQEGHVCLHLSTDEINDLSHRHQSINGLIGSPTEFTPLILDGHKLYFHRYWLYEDRFANQLCKRLNQQSANVDEAQIKLLLNKLFANKLDDIDWQKVAVAAASLSNFTIISGGPGTGKTSTVLRLLLLLQGLAKQPLTIRLAAPTGKAAARMGEGMRNAIQKLPSDAQAELKPILETLPTQAETLHRLLGPNGHRFTHHALYPLSLDVLVVDEASMIDQAMMYHLFEALPPSATVILLGDKDQLSSVDAGSVFSDLCEKTLISPANATRLSEITDYQIPANPVGNQNMHPVQNDMFSDIEFTESNTYDALLAQQVQVLKHSYRFASVPGIGALANAILAQDLSALNPVFEVHPSLVWQKNAEYEDMLGSLAERFQPYFEVINDSLINDPTIWMNTVDQFRVLTALKDGPYGALGINRALERRFQLKHWIRPTTQNGRSIYHGLLIMVVQNDYQSGLFNGDVGIVQQDQQTGKWHARFPQIDADWKSIPLNRLPDWVPAWAMTIHKSQGSEFDHVAIVLPNQFSPIINRSLLYTAVTRAKQNVTLWGKQNIVFEGVKNHPKRMSGLADRLNRVT
ncbi:exodeoxyribonuclease V subunit alpha [Leeia sp. TBRC 13508]|uniref:RecBCD enzyme subunit RecD n=1 Tax=Leeia speluncae TaxID=2884804 RepID=A0ABS8D966_9NEIS|nr:exodeoxyribonuclease V subunit alpha [Leeia speluncae]MCB6184481.1 exodeoxyribonuclease V subunit alpha [Leeia speluncae]